MHTLANRLLFRLRSLAREPPSLCGGSFVPIGEDMLSHGAPPPGEWRLHPQAVNMIWHSFGQADVDLFAMEENSHFQIYFSKELTLALKLPCLCLYTFPPVALISQVISQEEACAVFLMAPHWQNHPWFPELVQLVSAAPWPMLLKRDLLSQEGGMIWHPQPELWNLHVWPLDVMRMI